MSRIHNGLRRAGATPPLPFCAIAAPRPVRVAVEEEEKVSIPAPVSESHEESAPEPPAKPRRSWAYRLVHRYWAQRLLRVFGVRLGGPAPTCAGTTRLGNPCRGLAMANGLCRQHGGSRSAPVVDKARHLLRAELLTPDS